MGKLWENHSQLIHPFIKSRDPDLVRTDLFRKAGISPLRSVLQPVYPLVNERNM